MEATTPARFRWSVIYDEDGEEAKGFVPIDRHKEKADREYVAGREYILLPVEERSLQSHQHQFAWLHQRWLDLPETLRSRFPTSEHLRKHALIMTGYRDEQVFVCASSAEARRIATFLDGIDDDHDIVSVHGDVVIHWRAKSQSYRAMGKAEFQRSKSAVLQWVDDLIAGEIKPEQEMAYA